MKKYICLKAVMLLCLLVPYGAFAEKISKEELNLELIEAVRKGDESGIRSLLAKGADIETKDDIGKTPLIIAVEKGNINIKIVKLLLDKRAKPNAKFGDYTPLMLAYDQKEIVKELLDKGANPNIQKGGKDWTVLMMSAYAGEKDIVEMLLAKGAKVNTRKSDGMSVLLLASEKGHKEIVELLLNKGSDIKVKKNDGQTALMIAAFGGHDEVVKLLLDKGADVKDKDKAGKTALTVAGERGYPGIVQLLKDAEGRKKGNK